MTEVPTEKPQRSVGRTIARNTLFGFSAQFVLKVVSFLFQVLVVHRLGGTAFGEYSIVLAWTALFGFIGDLGITQYLTREIARNPKRSQELFWDVVTLRGLLAIIAMIVTIVGAIIHPYSGQIVLAIFLYTLTYFLQAFLEPLRNTISGNERLDVISVFDVIAQVIFIVAGSLFLFAGLNFVWLVIAGALNIPVLIVLALWIMRRNNMGPPAFHIQPRTWLRIIGSGLPFGLIQLSLSFAFSVDTIILSSYVPEQQTGWYNVAYNLTLTLLTVTRVFNNAILPTLAREHEQHPESIKPWYYSSVRMLMFIGLPIAIGGMLTASKIIQIYQPEIFPAAVVLAILVWDIPFVMYHSFCGNLTTSIKREKRAARIYGSMGIVNVVLNILLVPRFGIIGAAFVTVITDMLGAIQFYFLFHEEFGAGLGLNRMLRLLGAAALMGGVILLLGDTNLFIILAISAVTYLIFVWVSGTFSAEERTQLLRIANRLMASIGRRLRTRAA